MNYNNKKLELLPKVKFIRYLLPLICIGAAAIILLLKFSTLKNTVNVFQSMSVWLVCMAAIAQICSYLSSGYLIKVIVKEEQSHMTVGRGTLITMAAYSIGLAGGWLGYAAATYYWIAKDDDVSGEATLAGVLPSLYNTSVLITITIFGMLYLLFNHDLSTNQILVYGAILIITVLIFLIIFYALKHREKTEHLFFGIAEKLTRFLKRNYDLGSFHDKMDSFYDGFQSIGSRSSIKLAIGPIMNIVFDMLTLYLFFIAAGYFVNPSILLAGYSISFLLARSTFFIPGGVGVVEGGMSVIYANLGVPLHISVAVVLGYRLFSFWLPSLLGFAAMVYLKRTSERNE